VVSPSASPVSYSNTAAAYSQYHYRTLITLPPFLYWGGRIPNCNSSKPQHNLPIKPPHKLLHSNLPQKPPQNMPRFSPTNLRANNLREKPLPLQYLRPHRSLVGSPLAFKTEQHQQSSDTLSTGTTTASTVTNATNRRVILDSTAHLPSYKAKRRLNFQHAAQDWFLPGLDVTYEAMEELKLSTSERMQICNGCSKAIICVNPSEILVYLIMRKVVQLAIVEWRQSYHAFRREDFISSKQKRKLC
jgi:hypothetical protein